MVSLIKRKFPPELVLIFLLTFSIIVAGLYTFVNHGNNMQYLYFRNSIKNPLNNLGMDFYNSLLFAEHGTYQTVIAIYPPLNYLLYLPLAKCVPEIVQQGIKDIGSMGSFISTQSSLMLFLYVTMGEIILLEYILLSLLKGYGLGKSKRKLNMLVAVGIFFSGPVIHAAERGNNAFWITFLVGCFFLWYHSESKIRRKIAIFSLVVASTLKFYPVFFGIILLKERKWKDILKCFLYGCILFFVPFLFFGGIEGIIAYFQLFFTFVNKNGSGAEFLRIDLDNILQTFLIVSNTFPVYFNEYKSIVKIIILAFIAINAYASKSTWRTCLSLTLFCVLFPSFNFYYAAMLYWIPACLFITSNEKRKRDYIYAIAFFLVLAAFPYDISSIITPVLTRTSSPYYMSVITTGIGEIIFLLLLFSDFYTDVISLYIKRAKKKLNPIIIKG